jgi:Ice-binding-like
MRTSLGPNVRFIGTILPVLFAAGCSSTGPYMTSPVVATTHPVLEGNVHGGQQPLVGAAIQLYEAGTPATGGGVGLGSVPLITGTLPVTDAFGNFSITGDYTLPSTPGHYYIVATGGSPGPGIPSNTQSVLMAVMEGCTASSTLSPTLFININEVTTMATVLALQPFMAAPAAGNTGAPAIGAPATAYNALQNGFATANDLVNISTGTALKHSDNYGTTDNNALMLNTLADVLASCVNSDVTMGGQCSTLSTDATPSSNPFLANDTVQAAWYIAQNPANNVGAIYNLASATPPFVGLSSAPTSFVAPVATSPSACQAPVPLGAAGNYAVLAGSAITNSSTASDPTVILNGNIGVSPGTSETGFVTGTYTATIDNTGAATAEGDLSAAYTGAAGLLSPAVLPSDIGGVTFGPGLYNTGSAVTLNAGSVTLDGQGDPNAVFVFQIGTTFTAAGGTQVLLINGASANNVFWQVGSSATINGAAAWVGNILAYTSITMGTDATLQGRAMASNGAVTMLSNKITVP